MNIFSKKIYRLINSKRIFKLIYFFYKFFGEKDNGNIGFDFSNKPSRLKIVSDTVTRKKFNSYLEIGCFDNELFNHINSINKTGVDPIKGGTIRLTSDDFFRINKEKYDCVWIDGLHTYPQVRKDIINSLKVLNDDGIIFVHDCLPNNVHAQRRLRYTQEWNGDVWKAIVEIRKDNNLDVYTLNADHGIGVILKRINKNQLKININNFNKLKFNDFIQNHKLWMNIIEYEDFKKIY